MLSTQLQQIIKNRKHPLYITHTRSHTGILGSLAQGNDENDQLLAGNVLEASEFQKKHRVYMLEGKFCYHLEQAKETIRKCLSCPLYNQTPLPAESNLKVTQRNKI